MTGLTSKILNFVGSNDINKFFVAVAFLGFCSYTSNAQTKNVGIGTDTPNSSAILDLDVSDVSFATKLGFLAPRMTLAQRTAIATPATGLLVYQTDAASGFYYYTGSAWVQILNNGGGNYLLLSGGTMTGSINMGGSILTNIGSGASAFLANGGLTLNNQLTVSTGGLNVTGASTITGALTGLTGLTSSGTITFSGLTANQIVKTTAGGVLSSGLINLASEVSGTLSPNNGGTGLTSVPTNGQLLIGNGTGYQLANLTAGTNISITNGAGSINIAASGESPLTFNAPLSRSVNAISIAQAGAGTNGYLSSADWTSFNTKENSLGSGISTQYLRGDKTWQTLNTDAVPEATNQYYTDTKVRNAVSGVSPISVNTSNGQISIAQAGSGTNGYLSSADWTNFNNKENGFTAGTNAQYLRGDKTWQTLNTDAVPEGTNKYFTNGLARLAVSGSAPITYSSATGVIGVTANSSTEAGVVASGAGQANKVWKTDASGNPGWRNESGAPSAGTGIDITGGVISALNTNAIWNASKIQGLNISATAPTNGQALIWNNTSSLWEPGSASMPSGTGGQTLRHDGSGFVASSVILNDGTNVGIGTSPNVKLDVDGALALRDESFGGTSIPGGNRTYIKMNLTGTLASIGSGAQIGQILIIEFTNAANGPGSLTSLSNLKLSGSFNPDTNDVLTLIWNGSSWLEISFSAN